MYIHVNIIFAGLYQHLHFKYNSYSHYILGHHSLQLQASRVTSSNRQQCSQGSGFCVHKGCSIAGNVNTTLLQSGRVPDPGTNFGPACLQLHAVLDHLCLLVYKLRQASYRPCSFGSLVLWINSDHQLIC